jgi:hypothetical protein
LSFCRFPKDEQYRKAWVVAIRRLNAEDHTKLWDPTADDVVCSVHFKDEDFHYSKHAHYRIVNKGAIPSIFSWAKSKVCTEILFNTA